MIIMELIKAHVFTSEIDAHKAIISINSGEGIIQDAAFTSSYCTFQQFNDFWYISADETTIKYLGEPIEIQINNNFEIE